MITRNFNEFSQRAPILYLKFIYPEMKLGAITCVRGYSLTLMRVSPFAVHIKSLRDFKLRLPWPNKKPEAEPRVFQDVSFIVFLKCADKLLINCEW